MHEVITRLLDDEFLEIQAGYGTSWWGFGPRQPGQPADTLRRPGYQRLGESGPVVRTCDCFNIPIVMLVDVPGLPGTDQRFFASSGAAPSCYAYGEATVPKIRSSTTATTAVITAL